MINIVDKTKCCGCGACAQACPVSCIQMLADEEGFLYPYVDREKCINCHKCESVCQELKNPRKRENNYDIYAGYSLNTEIRANSSSGGIFSLLAEHVINNGGIVYGAEYDDNLCVFHNSEDAIEGLEKIRGSKYVQSDLRDCFKTIKGQLNKARKVLFSGTPCQVSALTNYLSDKEKENLISVEVICHGVPSPLVFAKYKEHLSEQLKGDLTSINFRDKKIGWKEYTIKVETKDSEQTFSHAANEYMRLFLDNISIRPSCSNCPSKFEYSNSDITLGDLWGAQHIVPEMDDNRGLSFISINTQKGASLFEAIKSQITYEEICFQGAVKFNPSLTNSSELNANRDFFFICLTRLRFENSVDFVYSNKLIKRAPRKIFRFLKNTIR